MVQAQNIQQLFPSFDKSLADEIAKHAVLKTFAEGEEIMRRGQNIKSTILVLHGLIKISREDENGNEIFMYHLEPGQACALSIMCAVQNRTSEINAKAVKDTEVLAIPIQFVEQLMKQHSSWYQFVVSTYRSRFEELLNTIDAIAFRNMDERLLLYLKKHKQILKTNIIPVTHAQIATELSTSREVISRLLKKLAEKGVIKVNRQNIEVVSLDKFPM